MNNENHTHNELGLLYDFYIRMGMKRSAANVIAEMERRSTESIVLQSFTEHTQRVLEFERGILKKTDYVTTYVPEKGSNGS